MTGVGLRSLGMKTLFFCDVSIALMTSVLPLILNKGLHWIQYTSLPGSPYFLQVGQKEAAFPLEGRRRCITGHALVGGAWRQRRPERASFLGTCIIRSSELHTHILMRWVFTESRVKKEATDPHRRAHTSMFLCLYHSAMCVKLSAHTHTQQYILQTLTGKSLLKHILNRCLRGGGA